VGARPRSINIVAPDVPSATITAEAKHACASLAELRAILDRLPDAREPAVLDLHGHATRGHRYVRFGGDAIDLLDPRVQRFFETLAADGVLARLRITAVRLLGCETAVGPAAQRTLVRLARVLGVPVYGTIKMIGDHHHDARGLRPAFQHLLVEASRFRALGHGAAPAA